MTDWYRIVEFGSYASTPSAPSEPFRGRDAAQDALTRFCERLGAEAGSHLAACSTRIVGPFPNRRAARETSISTYPDDLRLVPWLSSSWGRRQDIRHRETPPRDEHSHQMRR